MTSLLARFSLLGLLLALPFVGSRRIARADGVPTHWEVEREAAWTALRSRDAELAKEVTEETVLYDRGTGLLDVTFDDGIPYSGEYGSLVADQGRLVVFNGDAAGFARLLVERGILTDHPSLSPVQVAELAMLRQVCTDTRNDATAEPYRPAPPDGFHRQSDGGVAMEWGGRALPEIDYTDPRFRREHSDLQAVRYLLALRPNGKLVLYCQHLRLAPQAHGGSSPEDDHLWSEKPPLGSVIDWQTLEKWNRPSRSDGGHPK